MMSICWCRVIVFIFLLLVILLFAVRCSFGGFVGTWKKMIHVNKFLKGPLVPHGASGHGFRRRVRGCVERKARHTVFSGSQIHAVLQQKLAFRASTHGVF